ncbi:MAG: Flp pilus assembly protein CpaB [Pelobacteraceae bacterium]
MTRPQVIALVTIVALLFAGLASWGVYSFLQKESSKVKSAGGQAVVVAAVELPIGAKLDITHMKTVAMPKENFPQGAHSDPKLLVGRVVIRPLSPGDQITEPKLMPKEGTQQAGVMSYIVPQGHRAVTVGVNEVAGVAGFIAPNNRVDVVLTTGIPNNSKGETITKIVLQNVPVLATGQITEQKDGKPVVVPTVTMDLTPDDSEKLVHASHKGSLQLLLRNVIDTAPYDTRGTTINKVLAGSAGAEMSSVQVQTQVEAKPKRAVRVARRAAAAPAAVSAAVKPAAPPRTRHTITVIDGGVRTTKEFVLQ